MMSREANVRAILECNFTGFKDEIIDTAVELICDIDTSSKGELFTDDEKRMFLTSLAREQRVCEQVDIEYPNAKIKLVPIIHSIKEKVLNSSLWKEVEE